jgi:pimeloyl-ACP methyl ester carboxylesterase
MIRHLRSTLTASALWLQLVLALASPIPAAPGKLSLPGQEEFTVVERPAFVFLPREALRRRPQPWILYGPTLPGYPDEAERWMHEQFLAAGIAVAGIDVDEAYGSPLSHAPMAALYATLAAEHGCADQPCLFGRSRGGLWMSSWALAHPERTAGFIGIYPVFDFLTYPGLAKAAPAYALTPETLMARVAEFNPIARIHQLANARLPMTLIHGDTDTVVPLAANSLAVLRAYEQAGVGHLVQLIILKDQGHSFFDGYFHSQPVVDFAIHRARAGAAAAAVKSRSF